MIDRLVHHAEVIALKGDSYRLKNRDLGRVPAATTEDQPEEGVNFHPPPGGQFSAAVDTRVSLVVGRSRPELRGLHPKRGRGPWVEVGPAHSRRPTHASRSREPDASSRTARCGLGRRGSMRVRLSLSRSALRPGARRVGGTTRSAPSDLRRRVVLVGGRGCLRPRHESPTDGHRPGALQGLAMTNPDRKAPVRRVRHPEPRQRIARCACAAAATSQAVRSSLILPVRPGEVGIESLLHSAWWKRQMPVAGRDFAE